MREASVCKALVNIKNILFAIDTWGLTLHQLSQASAGGGGLSYDCQRPC